MSALTVTALVLAYAAASRVEFEIPRRDRGADRTSSLVPMLFLLPVSLVPLGVAGGLLLGSTPDYVARRVHPERVWLGFGSAWHALGPALVLALAGERSPSLSDWDLYLAALAAQFGLDLATVTFRNWLALDVPLRSEAKSMAAGFGVDAALAPIGLLAAIAAQTHALYFLLVLPLVVLLAAFAQQRRSAIDGAMALGSTRTGGGRDAPGPRRGHRCLHGRPHQTGRESRARGRGRARRRFTGPARRGAGGAAARHRKDAQQAPRADRQARRG